MIEHAGERYCYHSTCTLRTGVVDTPFLLESAARSNIPFWYGPCHPALSHHSQCSRCCNEPFSVASSVPLRPLRSFANSAMSDTQSSEGGSRKVMFFLQI